MCDAGDRAEMGNEMGVGMGNGMGNTGDRAEWGSGGERIIGSAWRRENFFFHKKYNYRSALLGQFERMR
jgi:hypothetical protein